MSSVGNAKIGVRTLASLVVALAILWYVMLWFFLGKPGTHLSSIPAFFFAYGPFICLALTLALVWDYFRGGKSHTFIFLVGVVAGISPLFFFALALWKSR